MAFFRNDAVNRVNLHSGVQALAEGAGGIFFLVYMLEAGVSVPVALLAQTAILAGRFIMRPAILPLAKRLGLKPMVIVGTLVLALQYPLLAEVDGVGIELLLVCVVASIGEVFYWPCYNAYFAAIGDAEHRGHQVSARLALVSVVGIVAPILGTWALVTLGARPMFAAVGVMQALAIVPLIGAPNVTVRASAPGAFRAARVGVILYAADGWLDAWFILVWQIALFISLGESISAYGGAMALAALVGAGCGMILGRHVDQGHGRRTVVIAYTVATAIVLMRALSFDSAWLAVISNALGALVLPLILPAQATASYNLAKASPCPMRFIIACEAGWDIGCASACLLAAALAAAGVSLSITVLLALPALAVLAYVLRHYFADGAIVPVRTQILPDDVKRTRSPGIMPAARVRGSGRPGSR